MKKKLLSLVLAGAMVASTSVSAFADTTDKTVTVGSGETDHKVTVTGNVTDNQNAIVPGTISVTIPTAVSFRVNSEGEIDSAIINIKSDSEESVDVIAYKFIDPSENSKITVVPESKLDEKKEQNTNDNRFISLSIKGGDKNFELKSADGTTTGIMKTGEAEYSEDEKRVIGTVTQGNSLRLRIEGKVAKSSNGYTAPASPIQDDFQLMLKIKKTTR